MSGAMKALAGVLLLGVWSGAALPCPVVPSAPLTDDDVRSVRQAAVVTAPDCRIEAIDGYGVDETAWVADVRCEPFIDQDERRISTELDCDRDDDTWTCRLNGTRVRYGRGAESVDLLLDPEITVHDGIRAFETCLLQQEFHSHYIQRTEYGFLAHANEGMMPMDADVVLGDKPSCLRRPDPFSSWFDNASP